MLWGLQPTEHHRTVHCRDLFLLPGTRHHHLPNLKPNICCMTSAANPFHGRKSTFWDQSSHSPSQKSRGQRGRPWRGGLNRSERMLPSTPLLGNCSFFSRGRKIWKFPDTMAMQCKSCPDISVWTRINIDTDTYVYMSSIWMCSSDESTQSPQCVLRMAQQVLVEGIRCF